MQLVRPAVAVDPRAFGRGVQRDLGPASTSASVGSGLRLFATTFLAGFVFVSVLLA